MAKLYLLLGLMFLGILYLALPYSEVTHSYFPLAEISMTAQWYISIMLIKLAFVIFSWIILNESDKYKFALWVFFGVQVLKFFDYMLCYNEVWLRIWSIPFSSNTLGFISFLFAVLYEMNNEENAS